MQRHIQRFRHDPDAGVYGDCARTALACLLDLEPEEVPHKHERLPSGGQVAMFREWLEGRGLTLAFFAFSCSVEEVLGLMAVCNPGVPFIMSGRSPRGFNHCVIAAGNTFVHDPSPDGGFLVGPCEDDHVYVELVTVLR